MTLLETPTNRSSFLRAVPPRPGRARLVAAVVVLALVGAGATLAVKRFTGLPGNAAFEYAGAVVTRDELSDRVELLGALYGISEPDDAKGRASFRRDAAKAIAVSMILDRAAQARDIVIADKSARDTLATMIRTQLGPDGSAEFTRVLGEFGVSERNVLDEVKRQQATARLFQDVTAAAVAGVTIEDARAYYDADPAKFAVPEKRRLRNIVVATRAEAEGILAKVRAGRDFGSLARRHSLDESTRDSRGSLGTVDASRLESSYARAAFAVPAGDAFGPVETEFGWNVGLVVAVRHGTRVAFDDVSGRVLDTVRSERATRAWSDFLADQLRKADVHYADTYRPAEPEAPPTDQAGTSLTSPGSQP